MRRPWRLGVFATVVLWAGAVSPTMLFSQESDKNSSSTSPAASATPLASPQMPAPTAQSASYQWVLSGPFYRTDWVPYHLRRCWGYQLCYQQVSVPYYAYVLTQVGERGGALPPGPDAQPLLHEPRPPQVRDPGGALPPGPDAQPLLHEPRPPQIRDPGGALPPSPDAQPLPHEPRPPQIRDPGGALPPGPDTELPIPSHESPYVGNPGPGSVR